MENGPLSPDGRSQWNGTEWVRIPSPPRRKGDTAYAVFIAFAIVLVVVLIIGVLAS